MEKDQLSNADLIRRVAHECGSHTNKWIKNQLLSKYKRVVSIQQVQQVLGTYKERGLRVDKYVRQKAAELIQACGYDNGLAMIVLGDIGRWK